MIAVEEAYKIILNEQTDFGSENLSFENAVGRILNKSINADRDFPPFNRVTMDGIAIDYNAFKKGKRKFKIQATQAAGVAPLTLQNENFCIEIMTGGVLPIDTNCVIRYEHVTIENDLAIIEVEEQKENQNIHQQGLDRKANTIIIPKNALIGAPEIGVMASVGSSEISVKKLPKVVVVSTGDELVAVNEIPKAYQIRKSNSYTISSALEKYKLNIHHQHIIDDEQAIEKQLSKILEEYDVVILSGGVSMGKFDYLPKVLNQLKVKKLFHKIKQRPGKPFWFGKSINNKIVFALPGNPVSSFMCTHRYIIPWLRACLGLVPLPKKLAQLTDDVKFKPDLTYFLQVKINEIDYGLKAATPFAGGGSGDFANLVLADTFMELPIGKSIFKKDEIYPIIPFR